MCMHEHIRTSIELFVYNSVHVNIKFYRWFSRKIPLNFLQGLSAPVSYTKYNITYSSGFYKGFMTHYN